MFRVGLAGYDLWPHTLAFVRALDGADFCRIVAVWDEDPDDLELLVKHTGADGYTDLDDFVNSDIDGGDPDCSHVRARGGLQGAGRRRQARSRGQADGHDCERMRGDDRRLLTGGR